MGVDFDAFEDSVDFCQQVIQIKPDTDFTVADFSDYLQAEKYLQEIQKRASGIAKAIKPKCIQNKISTREITEEVLPELVKMAEAVKLEAERVRICSVEDNLDNECKQEYVDFLQEICGYKIRLHRFNSQTRKKIIVYCGEKEILLKKDANGSFKAIAQINNEEKGILYIFYDNYGEESMKAVSEVLKDIRVPEEYIDLYEAYLPGNDIVQAVNYRELAYNQMDRLSESYREQQSHWNKIAVGELGSSFPNEVLYRLLTARGSYNDYCPICGEIPTNDIEWDEKDRKHRSRKLVLFKNRNTENDKAYIITIACKKCFENLRRTMQRAEFHDDTLKLYRKIVHGQHETNVEEKKVILSPVNREIIRIFKLEAKK